MKTLLTLVAVVLLGFQVNAQGIARNGSLTAELLGPGVFWSVNYEQQFGGYDLSGLRLRAGLGGRTISQKWITSIPISGSYLFQVGDGGQDYIELGAGYTSLNGVFDGFKLETIDLEDDAFVHGILGYRMVPGVDNGLFAKVAVTPLFAEPKTIIYGGVGIGYVF